MGLTWFALGFIGPVVLRPDANQGPLLGIFISGPLGAMLGLCQGGWLGSRQPDQPKLTLMRLLQTTFLGSCIILGCLLLARD